MTAYCRCGHSENRHSPKCATCKCKGMTERLPKDVRKPLTPKPVTLADIRANEHQPIGEAARVLTQAQRDAILSRVNLSRTRARPR
jgi:type IV pilus biogenesis protein CpaD/CtpE